MQNVPETLSQAVNGLTQEGYSESFKAEGENIFATPSKKAFAPQELKIVEQHRFEGETNPGDQTVVFAVEANDGTKGTLVMAYATEQDQNVELIKRIPDARV